MRRTFFGCVAVAAASATALAAELKPATIDAFNRYVRVTEARMDRDPREGHFLAVDELSGSRRSAEYENLHRGRLYVESLRTVENGSSIQIPGGLIHHWVGVAFIAGSSEGCTRSVLEDYDHHANIYGPTIRSARVLARNDDHFTVAIQIFRKAFVTAAFNITLDASYAEIDARRMESRARSIRIAQLEDPDRVDSVEKPVGNDDGFLWRLNHYWRVEQRDDGVYLQVEAIALTRRVPAIFAWLVNPIIRGIPRAVMTDLLTATRTAALKCH